MNWLIGEPLHSSYWIFNSAMSTWKELQESSGKSRSLWLSAQGSIVPKKRLSRLSGHGRIGVKVVLFPNGLDHVPYTL